MGPEVYQEAVGENKISAAAGNRPLIFGSKSFGNIICYILFEEQMSLVQLDM